MMKLGTAWKKQKAQKEEGGGVVNHAWLRSATSLGFICISFCTVFLEKLSPDSCT